MPSSVVATINYDEVASILRVTFVSGSVYDYKNVPEAIFKEMKDSGSKGTFLNTVIKRKYKYRKVR